VTLQTIAVRKGRFRRIGKPPARRVGISGPVKANLLEADPDLGRYLPPDNVPPTVRADVLELDAGPWSPPASPPEPGHLGYLILSGMLVRRLTVDQSRAGELLASGDLIRPWVEDPVSFCDADWRVMEAARLAILGRSVGLRLCARPELNAALLDKQMERTRSLAINAATENVRGLDRRLLILFWHLAERWGRREQGQVVVPLRLTHETLSLLVGARRPSVTTALGNLSGRGALKRSEDGTWILSGTPPAPAPPRDAA
jgi:CRP/FNR family transcriptional regulator, cyclic AMP receptor protein